MKDENESEEAVAEPMSPKRYRPPFAFAMIEGTAELSQDPDELRRAAVEINQRYEGGENTERFIRFATTALGSLVRVRPKRTVALDRVGQH